jgi:glutathione synthase/RimK-type ligase-like ATP-grasp enzyme
MICFFQRAVVFGMAILFVSGVNDLSTLGVTLGDKGQIGYLMDGNCSVQHRLPLKQGVAAGMVIFGKGVPQRGADFKTEPSLVFNQIADADTHRGALERCAEMCAQLKSVVINHPEKVMLTTRDRVSAQLQGIPGVIMPRTVRFNPSSPQEIMQRAEAEKFGFPFIVRVAGDHGGISMLRVNSSDELEAMHVFPLDGRDFYLTEYFDCRDDAGRYFKQRIVVVDGEPLLRHSMYGDNWIINSKAMNHMLERESWDELKQREARFEAEVLPGLKPAIDEITSRLKLEYYGIDCFVRPDGDMVVFEANANMNVLHNAFPQRNERMAMINRKIYELLTRYSGEAVI